MNVTAVCGWSTASLRIIRPLVRVVGRHGDDEEARDALAEVIRDARRMLDLFGELRESVEIAEMSANSQLLDRVETQAAEAIAAALDIQSDALALAPVAPALAVELLDTLRAWRQFSEKLVSDAQAARVRMWTAAKTDPVLLSLLNAETEDDEAELLLQTRPGFANSLTTEQLKRTLGL